MRTLTLILVLACCPVTAPRADDAGESATRGLDWGAALRFRGEAWDSFAFLPDADDTFLLGRLVIHADARLKETVRLFVQGKSALSTHRDLPDGTRTLDVDTLALQQAFVDLRLAGDGTDLNLLAGRHALVYGRQRLVSPLPWGNTLRAWDGAVLRVASGAWTVDAFHTWFVPVDKYDRNRRDSGQPFSGVYATWLAEQRRGVEFYALRRERADVSFNGTAGPERRHTFGARLFHQTGPWRGDLELAWQTGDVGADDVRAAMASLEVLRFRESGRIESVHLGLDYASGDRTSGGRVETFDQLFPLGHAFLGYMDFVGRQNIVSAFLRGRFRLSATTVLELTGMTFSRADTSDALYNAGGGVLRPGDASGERHVGEELDITLARPLGPAGKLLIGYSHFFPGRFIETSGASTAGNFGYVQYLVTF